MANLRRFFFHALAAALLAAAASGEPPLRRVVIDLRISSDRVTNALPPEVRSDLKGRVAKWLAKTARDRFGYLEWVPQPAGGTADVPLLVVDVFEEPAGANSPCNAKVRWRLVAEVKSARKFSSEPMTLDNGCDPRPRFQSERDLEDDLKKGVLGLKQDQWDKLHSDFLRHVPLVSRLEADPVNRKVLLPLNKGQLLASSDSELKVKFEVNQDSGKMRLQPLQAAGDRTQVQIYLLDCGNIVPCSEVVNPAGEPWVASLPGLLGRCTSLAVFMETYEPEVAATSESGVRTNLGEP